MSFPAYPAYKGSGVEWLGCIPSTWQLRRISDLARIINGHPFDSSSFSSSNGIPLVRIRDLNSTETETKFEGSIVESALITADDVLVGMDGDFNVGRWRGTSCALLNQRMCCIRGEINIVRFLEYALPVPLKLINDVTYSTTVKHLSSKQIQNIRVATPTLSDELASLLSFLDRETAKIDSLVAEQERLIALLNEKRQAVILEPIS